MKIWLKGLLYDKNNTPSFGRVLPLASFGLLSFSVLTLLLLLAYIVFTGQMEQAAPLAHAVSGPLSALFGSSFLTSVTCYAVTKRWPGGGVSSDQLNGTSDMEEDMP
jgi:hypothetical protein